MPRNMSFAMTTEQVRNQTKTVTRRFGWWFLKPGDVLQPVEKAMGLKRGEKIKRIGGPIRIVSVRGEPLNAIDKADCIREGFPDYDPDNFTDMLQDHYGCDLHDQVNRIEFEYIEKKAVQLVFEDIGEPVPFAGNRSAYAAQPGSGPDGETCKSCHWPICREGNSRNYWKCSLVKETCGAGTDIRLKTPACYLWKEKA